MKNYISRLYLILFYFSSTLMLLAQGTNNENGNLENTDAAEGPIDSFIWILAIIGISFVYLKFRSYKNSF